MDACDIRINGKTYDRFFFESVEELVFMIRSVADKIEKDGLVKDTDKPTNDMYAIVGRNVGGIGV